MTIFRRPRVARLAGSTAQRLSSVGERRVGRRFRARLPEFVVDRELVVVPTSYGPARAWIYRPHRTTTTGPVHLNLHGGGFVLGLPEQDDAVCRALCVRTGSVVINADYVLAPRHPFPAAVHQAYELACWVAGPGTAYGWDGNRLSVGGQSAGASLAAATARLALERGGPHVGLQVLHYPPLDLTLRAGEKHSPLAKPLLRPWLGDLFDTCYLPDRQAVADRLVSPAGPTDQVDLTGIAPAVIIVAELDILRDEAERYAARLQQVGALRELIVVSGRDHGYDQSDDEAARTSYARIAEHLTTVTGPSLADR